MRSVKSSVSGDVRTGNACISVRDIHTAPSFAAHQHTIKARQNNRNMAVGILNSHIHLHIYLAPGALHAQLHAAAHAHARQIRHFDGKYARRGLASCHIALGSLRPPGTVRQMRAGRAPVSRKETTLFYLAQCGAPWATRGAYGAQWPQPSHVMGHMHLRSVVLTVNNRPQAFKGGDACGHAGWFPQLLTTLLSSCLWGYRLLFAYDRISGFCAR